MLLIRPAPSSVQRTCSEILLNVCAGLDRAGVEWCIPHGYATYPDDVDPDDLDLIVRPEHAHRVTEVVARVPGTKFVQFRVHNGGTAVRYDLVAFTPERTPVVFGIDVSTDVQDLGVRLLRSEEFLDGRRRCKDLFWIPTPSVEFVHYLLKKLGKSPLLGAAALDADEAVWLTRLYAEDPGGCRAQLGRFFSANEARLIAAAAEHGRWEPVCARIDRLRRDAARKRRLNDPQGLVRYWIGDARRTIQRLLQPPTLVVAFLGLDGSGKSATIDRTLAALRLVFASVRRYHVRPGSGAVPSGEVSTAPSHAEPPWGPIVSVVKLGLWWLDYWAAFVMHLVPRLRRPAFVLFDRYYDDLLVDPRRYRFGGPMSLARIASRCVPRPDLVIFLDAPPQVAAKRKPGAGLELALRHREAYLALVRRLHNGHAVDASRGLDEIEFDVVRIIVDYMSARAARRLRMVNGSRGAVAAV